MGLNKQSLAETFYNAKSTGSNFVFVHIEANGSDEVISIPKQSFDAKEEFYNQAYSDDLVHVMNKAVFIKGLSYGEPDQLYNMV
jgi:hypothetical protein